MTSQARKKVITEPVRVDRKICRAEVLPDSGDQGRMEHRPLTVLRDYPVLGEPLDDITSCASGMIATREMSEQQIA